MIAPEHWKNHCTACDKDIRFDAVNGFKCTAKPGNHRVPSKTYFHVGGGHLQHPYDKRSWAPTLLYPRPDKADHTGKFVSQPPLEVQFGQQGKLDVDDSETQFNLETNSTGVGWGTEGLKQWESIYLTAAHRQSMAENKLAETNRQLSEANALLEQTKSRAAKGKPEAAA